jgi:5'-deoxynucleotidase YfbR-like HD superfamily hydrolase
MKRIIFLYFWLLTSALYAQPPDFQERLKQRKAEIEQAKREIITTRINLKPEQEKTFWEVYDKYVEERITLRRKIGRIRRTGFSMAASDADLEKNHDELLALRQKEVDMEKNYKTLLLKVINIRQFSELHRVEQEFMKRILDILRDRDGMPNREGKGRPPKRDDEED